MLPTGHVAIGFLTAFGVIKLIRPELEPLQMNQLLAFGAVVGFAPDLDEFYAFAKNRSWLVAAKDTPIHRKYFFHAPILWLLTGLIFYFVSQNLFTETLAIVFILSSLSHFVVDSIEFGIMWLWPINRNIYALKNTGIRPIIEEKSFFKHSFKFLVIYSKRLSFYLEVLIILAAILVLINLIS